jgi:CheY-like chemotaxis protein/HPt (histidine-containing phosphotransfer) domain-containing protein
MTDEKLKKHYQKESATSEDEEGLMVEKPSPILNLSGRILLATNSVVIKEVITLVLEKTGITVDLVENGQEALQAAISVQFDLILMDIQLPIMDGKETMACLQQFGINIPTYALTANITPSDIEEYSVVGFSGTLSTPLNRGHLYKLLSQHLRDASKNINPVESIESRFMATTLRLKALFFDELHKQHIAIDDSIENSNYDNLIKITHVIKGTAGSVGYEDLTEMADQCLTLLRQKHFEQGAERCAELNSKIASIMRENEKKKQEWS